VPPGADRLTARFPAIPGVTGMVREEFIAEGTGLLGDANIRGFPFPPPIAEVAPQGNRRQPALLLPVPGSETASTGRRRAHHFRRKAAQTSDCLTELAPSTWPKDSQPGGRLEDPKQASQVTEQAYAVAAHRGRDAVLERCEPWGGTASMPVREKGQSGAALRRAHVQSVAKPRGCLPAYSPGTQCRDRLAAGRNWIRTCMGLLLSSSDFGL
jgi:hypothetical protein